MAAAGNKYSLPCTMAWEKTFKASSDQRLVAEIGALKSSESESTFGLVGGSSAANSEDCLDATGDSKAVAGVLPSFQTRKMLFLIVGSAPGFPHGIVDPIEELGDLALHFDICFHVDLCLGGFVLPFARKLGYPVPPFDFTVQGVSSISVDIHKYGLGPKGTSVVLYRNHEIRKHQFVA
ncbi:hypothetical protein KI387_036617, partial [Taxus chinensis]